MRTRYYNPEVKRFINQDTILGSITNSQSLKRNANDQGNSISLIDPFGMSPSAGNNAIGHTLLDFTGLIPGIGFVFDVANSVWYVAEGNYTMAALAAFSAIPGLGDAVSAGKLATKGAKAAELCNMLKKLGYAARIVENAGEIAINVTNMYVDYAIKEKEFSIDTVASGLALGLNVFGIYASAKRYGKFCSETADVGKVTDGIEGGNKVAEKVCVSGLNSINSLDDLLTNPNKLSGVNGEELYNYLVKNGYDVKSLNRGSFKGIPFEEGGGFKVNWGGDRILQYHLENLSHHGGAYFKISSGETGTIRIDLDGNLIN